MTDPHLFLAKNAQGADALWWGTGPDDRRCQELDLSSLRRGNRDAEKAVWGVIRGLGMVEDCTDWQPEVLTFRCDYEGCDGQHPSASNYCSVQRRAGWGDADA